MFLYRMFLYRMFLYRWRSRMRLFIVAIVMALLTIPANSQMSGGKGSMSGAGGPADRSPPPPDKEKQKKDEKAFNDAVTRIPPPEKKYDPWGAVRNGGNR
jgi:hypothetical protein